MKNRYITLLIFAILLVFIIYILDIILLFSERIPFNVHLSYLTSKFSYNCGEECFYMLRKCTNEKKEVFFEVYAGTRGGHGINPFFDASGNNLCSVDWSVDICRTGGCKQQYSLCPVSNECSIIAGTEKSYYGVR
ncbi:hypothetical protein J4450_05765 [Candidatus Micrarchaeota archaeon]|nr:hypothetical protein [Candidatus Micrarchaeota archaeon]